MNKSSVDLKQQLNVKRKSIMHDRKIIGLHKIYENDS